MDSRTVLEHVLFQLTPTRTRCDMVIYGGGVSEKLASGLLQPFLSHLKTAQHQISKGGYSISLLPPPTNAYWFTKSTLQRFVRFVSTPEVLERFVTIEKELEQIESSVHVSIESADAQGPSGSYQKSNASDVILEDNSKVRLQRALETRKAVLRKEQAMAYARALVTGFELDSITDLISFADAFGASRLREACLNFMELCKKKNQDRLWMDEIAAMQASRLELPYLGTSGIVLASEENYGNGISSVKLNGSIDASDSSHGSVELNQDSGLATPVHVQSMDGKAQVQMPWSNHHPQYIHNFQGPLYQHMPPYQGYLYPGMQYPPPPYFPGNMQWPQKVDDWEPEDRKKHKSSSRNKKSSHGNGQDDSTEPSDSSSESESDENLQNGAKESIEPVHRKKHGKKSSRKVVIRNINYITSKRDGERESFNETSDGDEFIGEAIKQQVEEAVGSLGRQHKSTFHYQKKSHRSTINDSNDEENEVGAINHEGHRGNDTWGAFQSILLQDKDLDAFESEQRPSRLQEYSEMGMSSAVNLESEQIRNQRVISNDSFLAAKRETSTEAEFHLGSFEVGENLRPLTTKTDSSYEELLSSQRNEESKNHPKVTFPDHSNESLMLKSQKEGDWFISNQQDKSVNKDGSTNLRTFDGDYASSLAGDHFLFEESKKSLPVDDSFFIQNRPLVEDQSEPMLMREISMAADIIEATQYENGNKKKSNDKSEAFSSHEPDDLYMVLGRDSAEEKAISSWMDYENDPLSTEANETYFAEDKPSSNVKPTNETTGPGGKLTGKETKSKISNGTLGRSKTDLTSRTKKPTPPGKPSIPRSKNKEEDNRRRLEELSIRRQKRIAERSAASNGAAASKRLPVKKMSTATSAKTEDPKLQSASQENKKTVFRSSTIERLAAARVPPPKVESVQSKATQPKKLSSKTNGLKTRAADQKRLSLKIVKPDTLQKKESKVATTKKTKQEPAAEASQPTNSIDEFKDIKELQSIASVEKNEANEISRTETKDDNSSFHIDSSTQHDHLKGNDEGVSIAASVLHEDTKTTEMSIHPVPESPNRDIDFSAETAREINARTKNLTWADKSEIQVSTPPLYEIISEPVHSRKKWNTDETSPKAAKGFRKLLLFGRKSRSSTVSMA